MTLQKLKMHSPDLTAANIAKLAELFPNCVTEAKGAKGELKQAIDFDLLRQELASSIVEGPQERYQLNWPGKREALLTANAPIAKTLRPCREESVDFDSTQNLFIEGDNLDALKLLQETYLNKVKMIYIDPPYNTGRDFIYDDDFADDTESYLMRSNQTDESGLRMVANTDANGRFHSDWLTMMYSRLKLARNLLREDGLLFVSIDDSEATRLRTLCDEIFGEDNFISQLVWKKSYGGGAKSKHAVVLHEYILMYGRQKENIGEIELPPNEDVLKYYKYSDAKFEQRGPYRKQPLATNSMDERPNLRFPIAYGLHEVWPDKQWQWSQARVKQALENDELVFTRKLDGWTVDYKQYLKNEEGEVRGAKLYSLIEGPYTQVGTSEIAKIFGNGKVFTFPKPSGLVRHILGCIGKDGIIFDFFSGSASSAHAVMELNAKDGGDRRFILVQLPEVCDDKSEAYKLGYKNIAQIAKDRIRRAGQKIQQDNADTPNIAKLDIGFRVLKIDSSNMNEVYYTPDAVTQEALPGLVDNIRADRSAEDLLFQVLLDWGVDLALPISQQTIAGKTVFFVDGNALAACFETGIDEDFVKQLAAHKPLRVVFRDAGFVSDSVKINVEQVFKLLSPATEIKTL
jgi:adenine-specific DNA-methyltransferase